MTAHAVMAPPDIGWSRRSSSAGSFSGPWSGSSGAVLRSGSELEAEVVAAGDAGLVGLLQQLGDRTHAGKIGARLQVEPRLEHEGPLVRPRVRQRQRLLLEDLVADRDDVDVERTRLVEDAAARA